MKPNEDATPLAQDGVFIDPNGGGSNGPQFFNCEIDGVNYSSNQPLHSTILFGDNVISKVAVTDFFNLNVLNPSGARDTIFYSQSSIATFQYSIDLNNQYTAKAGSTIITRNDNSTIAGTFNVTMFKDSGLDSIVITNGRFSANK